MITFAAFKAKLTGEIWPSGAPENITVNINNWITAAMIDLQRFVDCLKTRHTTTWDAKATLFQGGLTIIHKPNGIVRRVWTIVGDNIQSRADYHPRDYTDLISWQKNLFKVTAPAGTGLPKLPFGRHYADSSTDVKFGRSYSGSWAMERMSIYLAPWIQSNETIVVEWDGLKASWADSDLVDEEAWTIWEQQAIQAFVEGSYEGKFGAQDISKARLADYAEKRAMAMHDCNERTRQQADRVPDTYTPSTSVRQIEEPDHSEPQFVIIHVGDNGDTSSDSQKVADLVRRLGGNMLLHGGDMYYSDTTPTLDLVDAIQGNFFHDRMYPYDGNFGAGADVNRLRRVLGNHDTPSTILNILQEFLPIPGNGRYYDEVLAPTSISPFHLFGINSGLNTEPDTRVSEPDGNTFDSIQGQNFQARMALSLMRWKAALFHHPFYTSNSTHAPVAAMNWPFKPWGADIVLTSHAHNYERLVVGGLTYIVNGAGGHGLYGFNTTPDPNSVLRYNAKYGALKLVVTYSSIVGQFWTVDNEVVDEFTITK